MKKTHENSLSQHTYKSCLIFLVVDDSDVWMFTNRMGTDNPYAKPWKDSDIILVLKDGSDESKSEEFHCHSTILTLNSPVFESMFKGRISCLKVGPHV